MTRDEKIRRVQLGIIRSGNADVIRDGPQDDDYLLQWWGEGARPFAEAIVDVIEATSATNAAPKQ